MAIVRVQGGKDGVAEYLRDGIKKDRLFSRDQMDKRLTLAGDLDVTDEIIKSLDFKENYHHVTISFKEDFVSEEDLQKAVAEFEKFLKAAYKDEEINFYAEAHIPKIKSYKSKSGELVIRKPHIHIVIPNVNMMTGKYIEPFGYVENNTHYIDSFQELLNQKNGFASPKDNRRNTMNNESAVIDRNKIDIFDRSVVEKNDILELIITEKIKTYQDLKNHLNDIGTCKVRNQGRDTEYLNVKFPHETKGINLKEFCFSREFVEEYPTEDKIDFLKDRTEEKYIEKQKAYSSKKSKSYKELQKEWFETRAKELKYIHSKTKAAEKYKTLNQAERIEFLNQKEKEFYEKHDLKSKIEKEVRGVTMDDIKLDLENSKEIENVRFKKNNAQQRADSRLYKSASGLFAGELQAENSNIMLTLPSGELVHDSKRVKELLSINEIDKLVKSRRDEPYNQLRWSDDGNHRDESSSRVVSHERKDKVENLVGQKLHDFYERKSLENLEIQGDLIVNTYDILTQDKGVLPNKIRYDEVEKSLFINGVSPRRIGIKEFLVQEMNLSANEIQDLQERINIIEREVYYKENKMSVNVNIKLNNRNPQKVDYYQMGREDVAGRFTGVVHDRASKFDTARAYVIDDKVVSLDEFRTSQKEMFNEIADKTAELFQSKTTIRYQDTLRMDVMNTEVSLTDRGKVYAHSQFNMRDMTPVEMGVTRFDKKLDKNFFTLAKEFITAKNFRDNFKVKVHEFKERVKSIITSKPELAASNVAMAIELKQLKQDLAVVKTYNAALEIASKHQAQLAKPQEQAQGQEQQQEKDPNEMTFKEVFSKVRDMGDNLENARDGIEFVGSEEFKDKRNTAMELLSNLKESPDLSNLTEQEIGELDLAQAKATNMMLERGMPVENVKGIDKFIDMLESVRELCDLNADLNFSKVLDGVLDKISEQSRSRESREQTVEREVPQQDTEMER
ncbi:MAG: hypothetical protein J7J31_00020 [Helicobacteraceae bacterium]|nr:hypothetical protein [Helicobacteraceae bacterium]